VFVATKTEGTGADRKVVPRPPEEIEKLRKIVQSALGLQLNDAARKDEITLEEIPFNDAFPVEVAEQMQKQQTHEMWWDVGRNAGYVLLALGIVVVFLRMYKKASAESASLTASADSNGNGKARVEEGVVTVEVLNRLIRENPANMNQAVRNWLSRGSGVPRN
jgi:flagellar biosynthesis/type III secretory pathway M-ring protein FliF/YscJ